MISRVRRLTTTATIHTSRAGTRTALAVPTPATTHPV